MEPIQMECRKNFYILPEMPLDQHMTLESVCGTDINCNMIYEVIKWRMSSEYTTSTDMIDMDNRSVILEEFLDDIDRTSMYDVLFGPQQPRYVFACSEKKTTVPPRKMPEPGSQCERIMLLYILSMAESCVTE